MAVEIVDLPKSTGDKNTSGMSSELWMIPAEWINTIPGPPDPLVNPGDDLRINGEITVNDPLTQGFIKVYVTARTAQMVMELVGQEDSKGLDIKFTFKRPGIDIAFLSTLRQDKDWVFAARNPDCNDNDRFVIGAACNPAKLMANNDTGLLGQQDAYKGWSGTLSYYGNDFGVLDESVNPLPIKP